MQTSRRSFLAGGAAALIAGAAPRSAWASTEADVIVIGAGLAGLHAAWMLEQAGQRVVVLEGSDRIGGRLHTLDDLPGAPEAGGVQVGAGYHRLTAQAARLGVSLIAGGDEPRDALYWIAGHRFTGTGWPGPPYQLNDMERSVPPAALGSLYARRLPQLASPEAWRDPEQIARLDRSWAEALADLGASTEAIRLINANLNGNGVDSLSALHVARTAAIFRSQPGPVRTIGGGSQRLPEAMAAALAGDVRTGQAVTRIREAQDGVTVRLADGQSLFARQAICTIPFSVLRSGVAIEAHLPAAMRLMIRALPYTRAEFLYLSARSPFWREDGYPATLWTDHGLTGRVFVLGDDPPMLKVWIAGPNVGAHSFASAEAHAAAVIAEIERARPSTRGQLAVLRRFDWQNQPFAHGIYHHIGDGQASDLAEATAHVGHRLHFAGEHLAVAASGMEGALESGERAAQAVLARS